MPRLQVNEVDLLHARIDFNQPGRPQLQKRRPVGPVSTNLWKDLATAVRTSDPGYVAEYRSKLVNSSRRRFNYAAKRVGLPKRSPTVLRHSGATLLAAAGVPIRQIAGMMGHSQQYTTERYAKHRPEYLAEAAEAMEELFESKA